MRIALSLVSATGSAACFASAFTRSARLTMPTTAPPLSTGARLMPWRASSAAISASGVRSAIEITGLVITSRTFVACSLM